MSTEAAQQPQESSRSAAAQEQMNAHSTEHRPPALPPNRLYPSSFWRTLLGGLAALGLGLNVIFCVGFFVLPVAVIKLICPSPSWLRDRCDRLLARIANMWIDINGLLQRATQRSTWDVQGIEQLQRYGWYLVTCNHQSWVDIMVLQRVLHRKVPLLKFFLKQQLIYVPFMGFAWWALDFPFMKRRSREYLDQHPEQRGQDLAATRRACERFSRVPTSVINFLEGTRLTAAKHAAQSSPYRHLLRPKAAGLALAVQALGDKFSSLLSVNILYPDGIPSFWHFLSGRVPRIVVRVHRVTIPDSLLSGDYEGNSEYRAQFQAWVNALWQEKDAQLAVLAANYPCRQIVSK